MLSSAFALVRMESGILGPLQGWLIDRFGARRVLTVGNVMFAAGATISGFSSLLIMVGMTSGPLFSGVVYDLTGSYRIAFLTLAGLAVLSSGAALAARPPAVPDR